MPPRLGLELEAFRRYDRNRHIPSGHAWNRRIPTDCDWNMKTFQIMIGTGTSLQIMNGRRTFTHKRTFLKDILSGGGWAGYSGCAGDQSVSQAAVCAGTRGLVPHSHAGQEPHYGNPLKTLVPSLDLTLVIFVLLVDGYLTPCRWYLTQVTGTLIDGYLARVDGASPR